MSLGCAALKPLTAPGLPAAAWPPQQEGSPLEYFLMFLCASVLFSPLRPMQMSNADGTAQAFCAASFLRS